MVWFANYYGEGSGGGGGDTVAPVISNKIPVPSVLPGLPGGFPLDRAVAKVTPITFDIVDVSPGIGMVAVYVQLPNEEDLLVAFEGSNKYGRFILLSTRTPIANGFHYSILPKLGWPDPVPGMPWEIIIRARAIDGDGNVEP